MISLTDAPVIINRYRNLDYIFNNSFIFSDRYSGGADEWGKARVQSFRGQSAN